MAFNVGYDTGIGKSASRIFNAQRGLLDMYLSESEIDWKNPRSLFKYRAFDQNAPQSLVDGKIWLAEPKSFNDPFDSVCYIDRKHGDEELLAYLNDCAESKGEARRFTPEDILRERKNYESMLDTFEEGVRNAGIFCLTATPLEPLMWAHYTDGHRGFCIEYERTADNDLAEPGCLKVEYDDPAFPLFRGLDYFAQTMEVLQRVFTHKARSWGYEYEWRLIRMWKESPGERSYRLNARIVSISFGLRMPRRNALTIIRALRHHPEISYYKISVLRERLALQAGPFHFSEEELNA